MVKSSQDKETKSPAFGSVDDAINHEILYRNRIGKHHTVSGKLSGVYCASLPTSTLYDIHAALGHHGVTKMHHSKRKIFPITLKKFSE